MDFHELSAALEPLGFVTGTGGLVCKRGELWTWVERGFAGQGVVRRGFHTLFRGTYEEIGRWLTNSAR